MLPRPLFLLRLFSNQVLSPEYCTSPALQAVYNETMSSLSDVKVDLFTKIHAVNRLSDELQKLAMLSKKEQNYWLDHYQEYLSNILNDYLDDSAIVLDGIDSDRQMLDLSLEYISRLRDVLYQVDSFIHQDKKLQG